MVKGKKGAWVFVEENFLDSSKHFRRAARLHKDFSALLEGSDTEIHQLSDAEYAARMAICHAMQIAHTSLEMGLERAFGLLEEPVSKGASWHKDIIDQAKEIEGRPAILSPDCIAAAHETRAFRNIASRRYQGDFLFEGLSSAVTAGAYLSENLNRQIEYFLNRLNPPEHAQ